MAIFNSLYRSLRRRPCECVIIITWMILLLSVHLFVWNKCEECICPDSEEDKVHPRPGSADELVRRSDEMVAGLRRRPPGLDPLRWRNDPEEVWAGLDKRNIEYGVNVVPSLNKAIEGDIWHPLKHYQNPCWVEKVPLGPKLAMDSPEQIRARFSEIRKNGFNGRSRRGYPQYRDVIQPTPGRRSRMDDHVLNMTSVKAEADMRYQLSLYQRAQEGVPWKMRCLPYVYLIGVTKGGTSDFYRYLTSHQDVIGSRVKEIHYWNVRRFPRYTKLYGRDVSVITFDSYLDNFDVAAHQINNSVVKVNGSVWHPKITIDGSVSMFWEDTGWKQVPGNSRLLSPVYTTPITLAHFQPKAKLILMLREPVDRVYSYYRMFAASKLKSDPEAFHNETVKVLKLYQECLRGRSLRECAYDPDIEQASFTVNIRSSLYAAFMPDWLRVFPRDQIYVIRSEDYFANRKPILDDVIEFLNLAPYSDELLPIINDPLNTVVRQNSHNVPMYNKTRILLQRFFEPFNDDLDRMLSQRFWIYNS